MAFPRSMVSLLILAVLGACSPPPETPAGSEVLPFDRQSRSGGVSPTQSVVSLSSRLAEGTPIPVRLVTALSSATARAGTTFHAKVSQPVTVDGLKLIAEGLPAAGRVLEAKAATDSEDGYLRLVLTSLNLDGRTVAIETSSIFAKGRSRNESETATQHKDVTLAPGRQLEFRLAQAVDLGQR